MPMPDWERLVLESACRKISKMCGRNDVSIPCPLSSTVKTISSGSVRSLTTIRPSRGVNFTALFSRFQMTCRSEEHTSELQSQSNLVCRLLLEKKNIFKQNKQ